MKKKLACSILMFLSCAVVLTAQQQIIDSLEKQFIKPTNGLSKTKILNELSWYYALSDPEKGLRKADMAIVLSKKNQDSLQLGIAYERKGFNYENMGKDSLAIALFKDAEGMYKMIDHENRFAAITFNKGNFYFNRSQYTKSLKEIEKLQAFYESNNDSIRWSRLLNLIALNHLYLGNYPRSMETFKKGQLLLELTESTESQFYAEIIGNSALLHEKTGNFKQSLVLQEKALKIHRKNGYDLGIANTLSNIGKIYGINGDHYRALEVFTESLKLKREMGNPYRIANGLTNLGITLSELKNYSDGLQKLNEARTIYLSIEHFSNLSTVHKNIGDIYLELSKPKEAFLEFQKALRYSKNNEDKRAVLMAKEGLSKSSFEMGQPKKAYALLQDVVLLKDQLLSNEKRDELAKIVAKHEYEIEKAVLAANFDKENVKNQANIDKQVLIRNSIIVGSAFSIMVLVLGFILVKRKKEAEFSEKLSSIKLQAIQAQLNPHFIFNTLNAINDYVQRNDGKSASDFLVRFSKMMRTVLNFSRTSEVSLKDELDFLKDYITLERQRLNFSFEYFISVDGQIDVENTFIPPSLLQPIIENSIWHGLSTKEGGKGKLCVKISKNEDTLKCSISDNGAGLKDANSLNFDENHPAFGTASVQKRLNLLNDIKGNMANRIEVEDLGQGLKVVLAIPYTADY